MFHLLCFLVGVVFCNFDRLHALSVQATFKKENWPSSRSKQAESALQLEGWNYNNLHCRDNDNAPVDWWILYKPSNENGPFWESGQNFTYITSESSGKWNPSVRYITSNSMLQYTLSPLFRATYHDYLAVLSYQSKRRNDDEYGSSAQGILISDEMGGVWMPHTISGFPDLTKDRLHFPESELANGHMLSCFSLSLTSLNEIAELLREVQPEVVELVVPEIQKEVLTDWFTIGIPDRRAVNANAPLKEIEVSTNANTLRATIMVRPPGDSRCLYKSFARKNKIVMDVYGHDHLAKPVCERKFSVRNMDAISLKYPESVYYINNKTDRVGFAVSTPGKWPLGSTPFNYWSCTSTTESEDTSAKGGLIVCIDDYSVWRSFELLKIKDPEC